MLGSAAIAGDVVVYSILGPLEVRQGEARVEVGGGKQRALLALLLTRADEVLSVDAILDRLWEEHPPATAKTALQGYVSALRKAIPAGSERLQTGSGGYVLRLGGDELDARRFEELAESGRGLVDGDPERAASLLREALGLWRGPGLADFAYDAFAQAEIARLEEARLAAAEDLNDAELACGRHADLVGRLEAEIAAQPLRERLRGQLILALYRSGRQAEALQAYQATREVLVEELGIDPSPALQRLEKAILVQDPSLDAPAPPAAHAARVDLPARVTAFVGRETELGELTALVRDGVRLVTLTGPGGTGKTRLAVETAYALAEDFPDGVRWVPLETLRDPALVLETVGQALGGQGDPAEQIGDRRLLLVLDNLEQVIACAPDLARLLTACSGLTLLATSREPLRVAGEQEYPVPTLSAADGRALFVARARLVQPSFEPTGAVDAICRRLDDLPLALELAAARTKLLSPEQLLERLASRLDLLKGGRDADPRRQTLRATIEWSFDLLTAGEQELFARLAVFSGGCTLAAAEHVADADLDTLQSLLDKSLLKRRDDLGEPRFWMLETIREFAHERLVAGGAEAELRERHARWALAEVERHEADFHGSGKTAAYQQLGADYENIRAALAWAAEQADPTALLRLTSSLGEFWFDRDMHEEARPWLELALARLEPGAVADRLIILRPLVWLCYSRGDAAQAAAYAAERRELATELGDPAELAGAFASEALVAEQAGDNERALKLQQEAVALRRQTDDARTLAIALINVGCYAEPLGRIDVARTAFEEALELFVAIGEEPTAAQVHANLAWLELNEGFVDRAEEHWRDTIPVLQAAGFSSSLRNAISGMAQAAVERGELLRGARLSAATERSRREAGEVLAVADQETCKARDELLRARLDPGALAEARALGAAMTLEEAAAYACDARQTA